MMITQKELNYIETLYLYANLEDFFTGEMHFNDWLLGEEKPNGTMITSKDIRISYDIDRYNLMLGYITDTLLSNAEYIGESEGRKWYKFPNYRLGIMDYDKAKKTNQPNATIQYEQHYMFTLNKNLDGIELPFEGTRDQYKIKRIDVTKIAKIDHNPLINKGFISPYRTKHIISNSDKVETVYLGHRKNGNVYRMYNKTKELLDTENYKKMELLSTYFGDIENLYTFELELHRKHLKEVLGIKTLADLDKVYSAYSNIVGKIRIYDDNDHNKRLIEQNNRSRIDATSITPYVDYERVQRKQKKPSKTYLKERIEKALLRYIKSMCITDNSEINNLRLELAMSIAGNDKQDVTIEFSDTIQEEQYKAMYKKVEILRGNQDDQLWKEANRAFAPIFTQNAENLF